MIEEKTHPGVICLLAEMGKRMMAHRESGTTPPEPYALLATVAADLKAPAQPYAMAENALESFLSRDKTVLGVLASLDAAINAEEECATAHHEAGHAVAALVLGIPIRKATIMPDDRFAGKVTGYPRIKGIQKAQAGERLSRSEEEHYLRCMVMLLAGGMAAQKYTGALGLDGRLGLSCVSPTDREAVFLYLATVTGIFTSKADADDKAARLLEQSIGRTEHWLADSLHWYRITNIACALVEHRTLTSKQIQAHYDRARVRHNEIEQLPAFRHEFGSKGIPA